MANYSGMSAIELRQVCNERGLSGAWVRYLKKDGQIAILEAIDSGDRDRVKQLRRWAEQRAQEANTTTEPVPPAAPVSGTGGEVQITTTGHHVRPGYEPACWQLLGTLQAMLTDGDVQRRAVLLHGPPGTGKTTFAHRLAADMGRPCVSITTTRDTAAIDLWGQMLPSDNAGAWGWHKGPAHVAWHTGGVLCLNEVNEVEGDGAIALHAILDDPDVARYTLQNGEEISPREGFACVATMNGTPDDLHPALRNRFAWTVCVDMPAPGLVERCGDYGPALVNAYESVGDDGVPFVTARELLSFVEALRVGATEDVASQLAFGSRPSPRNVLDHLKIAKAAAQSHA